MSYDLVIRNGTVVDGSGAAPRRADVAVRGDRIAAVGDVDGTATRTIDAEGQLVTPGFVDIHTHLDAQIGWDPTASSPCWHGVTSVVMGNCGVTFAPCRPDDREFLARLMESVEDIPATSIMEGLPWTWETYGEYLDVLEGLPKGVNVGGMVGHCAVRWWAMGPRSLEQKVAGDDDVERMREIVREAVSRGALGFSTSRTLLHKTPDGEPVPGTFADATELLGIGRVLAEEGRGVFEGVPYLDSPDPDVHRKEIALFADVARETGRPVTFGFLHSRELPDLWKESLAQVAEAAASGARLRPQTQVRSVGILFGLVHLTPWDLAGGAWGEQRSRDLAGRIAAIRDEAFRARLVADAKSAPLPDAFYGLIYRLPIRDGAARYDVSAEESLLAEAKRRGTSIVEAFLDIALETDGRALFLFPFANHEIDVVGEMLRHPQMLLGLADSGAHCGQIMDASLPTYLLSYWVRERGLFPVEEAIRKLTSEPAEFFGLRDRGTLRAGAFADLTVFDMDALRVLPPEYVHDFPAGAGRYVQRAEGFAHTVVNGAPFMADGVHTGATAGRLLRSTD